MRYRAAFALLALLATSVMVAGGAGCARTQPRADPPPRIKDSVPEKIAAQRAAQSNLNLQAEDERWGVEAARERKRKRQSDASDAKAASPPSGPTDLRPGTKATVAPR